MQFREMLLSELVKKGHQNKGKNKVWNMANRSFLYATPQLAKLFLKLNTHPRYKKTVIETELNLIKKNSEKFAKKFDNLRDRLDKVRHSSLEETHVE